MKLNGHIGIDIIQWKFLKIFLPQNLVVHVNLICHRTVLVLLFRSNLLYPWKWFSVILLSFKKKGIFYFLVCTSVGCLYWSKKQVATGCPKKLLEKKFMNILQFRLGAVFIHTKMALDYDSTNIVFFFGLITWYKSDIIWLIPFFSSVNWTGPDYVGFCNHIAYNLRKNAVISTWN